ncbi:murein biosynthesis integral membrane protein MurJ [[Phormidium] sp. ETS-05]|uniref:murein biosynthesis integral membrane protein MurJ n=1 Tax=[Phormidium] sp. ETS-05 TaxID=222819 RepID=UPI0018EEFF61|nr:murein biosynthesis integral membrane protein MurJ [[Phormidium] sp. ETS-05]
MLPSKIVTYWNSFTNKSTNRKIFGAAVTVGLMTVLVQLAGAGKELVVAWRFGTGDDLDAFLIAVMVPSLLVNIVGVLFQVALIPTYIKVREREGAQAAQRLLSSVTVLSLAVLGIMTIAMLASAPWYLPLIGKGFEPEKLDIAFHLLWITAPVVIIRGIGVIWGGVVNAGERFALVALAPILTPVMTVILIMAKYLGIYSLAVGWVCGMLCQFLVVGATLKIQGSALCPRWYGLDTHQRQVMREFTSAMAGAVLMSSNTIIDQGMAAMLSPGSVASLNYGNKVIAFPIGLLTTALSTAIIPYFSKMVSSEDWSAILHTFWRYMGIIFMVSLPFTIILCTFTEPIIQFVFQRGAFTSEDTQVVAKIQFCYAVQIPSYIGVILVVRLISAFYSNQILLWAALISAGSNIILNYILIKFMGVSGIALSTSIVSWISFGFLLYSLFNLIKRKTGKNLIV